jgi:predicted NAD/FAD-dependent oxidoreductase
VNLDRRSWLGAVAAAPLAALGACAPPPPAWTSRWVGAAADRGHRLRDGVLAGPPAVTRRAGVLVVGAGIAGLTAARALAKAGIDDVHVLDLEDAPGGNSRGHRLGGMDCPLGAHYLPTPGERAVEVIELLEDLGLRRRVGGRVVYDERHLCHSPQERLYVAGHWHEGLLPPIAALPAAQRAATLAQYRRYAATIERLRAGRAYDVPTARAAWTADHAALDATSFSAWLDAQGYDAPALRWYLDYCCRDDYGAGAAQVSAWAGVHYFASRHGFHAPGEGGEPPDDVLTWPQGNGWLSERLAAPLGGRLHTGQVVQAVGVGRHAVEVDCWSVSAGRPERWTAGQVVLAVPLFVARHLLAAPPAALVEAAATLRHAPWLVANLHLATPLDDRPGAPPSWDNVLYDSPGLGYVDAMHQSTRPHPGPTVLTAYWALGGATPADLQAGRRRLLEQPAATWAEAVLADLGRAHADLPARVAQIDLMRYGHAMSVPSPGVRGSAALQALAAAAGRLHHAHSDLSGYSVFEESMYHGARAAAAVVRALRA